MRIVVSDGSCLNDLRKVSLLDAFLKLPHEIHIPNTLFEDGHFELTISQKCALIRDGLKVIDLPAECVLRVQHVLRTLPHLSVHSGFAFAIAERHPGCSLLTDDRHLHSLAEKHKIPVLSFFWIVDEIHQNGLSTAEVVSAGLRLLAEDPAVNLPRRELAAYMKRYCGLR